MANSPLWNNATVVASINAVAALLNSGTIQIRTGTQPAVNGSLTGTLLATLTFGSTAFPTATASGSGGTATANTVSSGTASAGTAGYVALVTSGSATVMTGSVGTSGADLNISPSLTLTGGATVAVGGSGIQITQVQT